MSEMREKDQADWDLERCFEMFDEALISKDERVVNALRNLLMVVTLTAPESDLSGIDSRQGPLRRMIEDQRNLIRRLNAMEDSLGQLKSIVTSLTSTGALKLAEANWPYLGGSGPNGGGYGGGLPDTGGGYGGGLPGVTAVGKFHTTAQEAHEVYIQNKIRGLKDDEY